MIEIENYFKTLTKDGVQVGLGLDFTALALDRAAELYPKNKKQRQAFQQGMLEAVQLHQVLSNQNEKFDKKKSRLVGLDGKTI